MVHNEKQIAIIDTAEKLFSRNGFEGTSVRDIAHEAGINVAMISYYFGSKEKLMEAIFERKTSYLKVKIENLIDNKTITPYEKICLLIDDYVDRFYNQREFHKVMMREQIMEKNTVVMTAIIELKKKNLESITELITEGQNAGVFRRNIDVMMMVTTMVGTVSQMFTSCRFYKEVSHMEQLTDEEFMELAKKKLRVHLKILFKALLTYDETK
jgi:AcrR family transcriptional regulator